MIVVDASAVVELLLRRKWGEQLAERLLAPHEILHAPHLLDAEIAQVFRRLEAADTLTSERVEEAIDDFRALRLVRHPHTAFLSRVWSLRNNLSAYDALYIALAESLDAPLVTLDRRLAKAPGHDATVEMP